MPKAIRTNMKLILNIVIDINAQTLTSNSIVFIPICEFVTVCVLESMCVSIHKYVWYAYVCV